MKNVVTDNLASAYIRIGTLDSFRVSPRLKWTVQCGSTIGVAAVSAFVLVHILNLGMINNGDGGRILRSGFVAFGDQAEHVPLPPSFPMQPLSSVSLRQFVPLSPAAAIVLVVAITSKLFGLTRLYMTDLATVYFATYYVGSFLLIGILAGTVRKLVGILVCAFFLLNPYLISYFFSVYEESLTLALIPLWCYLAISAFSYGTRGLAFLAVTLAIVASKSTLIVLLLAPVILCFRCRRPGHVAITLLVVAASFAAQAKSDILFNTPNSFNRLYMGLAYSLADVSHWPGRTAADRFGEAPAFVHPKDFNKTGLPAFASAKWGHSYYAEDAVMPEEMAAYANVGKKSAFVKLLAWHPQLALISIRESFMTAILADYTQSYHQQANATDAMPRYQAVFRAAQRHAGLLFVLAIPLLALSLYSRNSFAAVLSFAVLVSPFIVVLGDGYSDFEKHLLPFLIMMLFSMPLLKYSSVAHANMREVPSNMHLGNPRA